MKHHKKSMLSVLAVFAVLLFSGCAEKQLLVHSYAPEEMIHYSDLTAAESIGDFRDQLFYVNAGETIPVKMELDTDFLAFKQDSIDLVAKKKLYFRIQLSGELSDSELAELGRLDAEDMARMSAEERSHFMSNYTLYISNDALHWASLYDLEQVRKVLGVKHGQVSLGFMASASKGLSGSLKIATLGDSQ